MVAEGLTATAQAPYLLELVGASGTCSEPYRRWQLRRLWSVKGMSARKRDGSWDALVTRGKMRADEQQW